MASKFVLSFCALFAVANAGSFFAPAISVARIANPSVDAVGTTHQNVVRSFGGTVSTYSKAVDTPYSSVRKVDSRITNNVYAPAITKAVTTYAAPATTFSYTPAIATPIVAKSVVAAAPVAVGATYAAAPIVKALPIAAPAYVRYSPAVAVAHVAFDGFGSHWGY